jgi:hypothetical protein
MGKKRPVDVGLRHEVLIVSETQMMLRLNPAANNQVSKVHMARDYLLDVALATTLRPAPPRLAAVPE